MFYTTNSYSGIRVSHPEINRIKWIGLRHFIKWIVHWSREELGNRSRQKCAALWTLFVECFQDICCNYRISFRIFFVPSLNFVSFSIYIHFMMKFGNDYCRFALKLMKSMERESAFWMMLWGCGCTYLRWFFRPLSISFTVWKLILFFQFNSLGTDWVNSASLQTSLDCFFY